MILNHLFNSLLFMQSKSNSGYGNYLYFIYLLKNEDIISQALLYGMEFELSVRCNQTRSSLVKTSALLLVLIDQMARAHFWYVIKTGQSYWLDGRKVSSEYYWVDDKRLTIASYHYARVVVRWLEVLASYTRQPNLTVIMFRLVLEQLKAWRDALSPRQVLSKQTLIHKTYKYEKIIKNKEDNDV